MLAVHNSAWYNSWYKFLLSLEFCSVHDEYVLCRQWVEGKFNFFKLEVILITIFSSKYPSSLSSVGVFHSHVMALITFS